MCVSVMCFIQLWANGLLNAQTLSVEEAGNTNTAAIQSPLPIRQWQSLLGERMF